MSSPTETSSPSRIRAALLTAMLLVPALAAAQAPEDWRLVLNVSPFGGPNAVEVRHPTIEERVRLIFSSDELDCRYLAFGPARIEDQTIRVEAVTRSTNVEPCTLGRGARSYEEVRTEPLGESGIYTVEVRLAGELLLSQPLEVWEPSRTLYFSGGAPSSRYTLEVRVLLTDPRVVTGLPREAASVRLTPETGYWWFFDPDNVEVTVKVLDGRAVDGKLWLFVTGMTDLGLTVEARAWGSCSGEPCSTHRYVNPPGRSLVVVDGIQAGD